MAISADLSSWWASSIHKVHIGSTRELLRLLIKIFCPWKVLWTRSSTLLHISVLYRTDSGACKTFKSYNAVLPPCSLFEATCDIEYIVPTIWCIDWARPCPLLPGGFNAPHPILFHSRLQMRRPSHSSHVSSSVGFMNSDFIASSMIYRAHETSQSNVVVSNVFVLSWLLAWASSPLKSSQDVQSSRN